MECCQGDIAAKRARFAELKRTLPAGAALAEWGFFQEGCPACAVISPSVVITFEHTLSNVLASHRHSLKGVIQVGHTLQPRLASAEVDSCIASLERDYESRGVAASDLTTKLAAVYNHLLPCLEIGSTIQLKATDGVLVVRKGCVVFTQ